MKTEIVENLVSYLAEQLGNLSAPCSTIRLVKYLYLLDIEYYRKNKRILTNIDWVRYKYGPYFFAMPDVMRSSVGIEVAEFPTENGFSRSIRSIKHVEISKVIDFPTEQLIQSILKKWAHEDLKKLLDHVYKTPPMKNAEMNERLDFSTLAQMPVVKQKQWHIRINPEDSIAIQSLLEKRVKQEVPPKQFYDHLYFEALEIMDSDERQDNIITGQVRIDPLAYDLLNNQKE